MRFWLNVLEVKAFESKAKQNVVHFLVYNGKKKTKMSMKWGKIAMKYF